MVRRIREPGCKYDYMVILQGPQGCKKSLFCKTLAGGSEFFEESVTLAAGVKQLIENTAGKWVVEIPELVGLTAKDIEHQKALITRTVDRCRAAYGYYAEDVPRQFVFLGTTNEEVFLCDSTGNAERVVTKTMLLENVWDFHFDPKTNIVETLVSRLRSKIDCGRNEGLIQTVRGSGYMIGRPD